MKLRSLLEIEYGIQDVLAQHMDQIKMKYGPEQYRQLQTLMSQQKDSEVEKWINQEKELGKLEDPDDAPPNDKAIPLSLSTTSYEVDALNENEEYCPVCANKLKESVKKSVNELMEKEKPGLWANIRAKRAKVGKKGMAKKGSKAYKTAKKAGDKINKEVDEGSSWDGSASKNPGMWDGKPSEKQRNKPFPAMGEEVDEAKTKPAKGKRFAKKVKNPKTGRTRTVSYGQAGKAKKGGDRIRPGTAKGNAYCARSAKIKKCKNPPCANTLSRKKWKCQGSRSVK